MLPQGWVVTVVSSTVLISNIQPKAFSDRSLWKSLRVVDVRALGSWISAPKCLLFQDFERPDRSYRPGHPRE